MGRRRKQGLLDVLIRLPWWMGDGGALLILAIRPLWLAWAESGAGIAPLMEQFANIFCSHRLGLCRQCLAAAVS